MLGLSPEDVRLALVRVLARTKEKRAGWAEWQDSFELVTKTSKFEFYISSRDEDDSPPFIFQIWRKDPVDGEHGPSIKVGEMMTTSGSESNSDLAELYMAAKLSAHGLNDLSTELLSDLE